MILKQETTTDMPRLQPFKLLRYMRSCRKRQRLHPADREDRLSGMTRPKDGRVALRRDVAPFWRGFPNFDSDPTVSFLKEFSRLASRAGWNAKTRRKQLARAVLSEMAFTSNDSSRLEQWKMLCREVGIGDDLHSITQCRKVSKTSTIKPARLSLS